MEDTTALPNASSSATNAEIGHTGLWHRFGHARLVRALGIVVVIAAAATTAGSFFIATGATKIEPAPHDWTIIWIVNAVLILMVIALVLTEVVLLVQARMRKQPGARLQTRMVTLFALVAAVPAFIVAVVATVALDQGLDQWFSERTRAMVEASRLVARSYLNEHAQVLRDDIIAVANELEASHDVYLTDPERFKRILTSLAVTRSLPFSSLVNASNQTIMRAQINAPGKPPNVPDGVLPEVKAGAPTLIAPGATNLVGAVVKLRGYDNIFLFVARPVDQEVLEYMHLTDENITQYRKYASNRVVFQITFAILYVGVALVVLLAALWIGIALANRFVTPIRNLMLASNRVSRGDLSSRVPVTETKGDLHDLTERFNRMTEQLEQQREALLLASETNEKRRQFTEAVVAGVSSGVIGLDPYGLITLVNATACHTLGKPERELLGEDLEQVAPELAPILERARKVRRGQIQEQIRIGPEHDRRTYQVRLTREGTVTESKGFVITLDDISELVTAQRNSAWADVARRIAHEIKNPLTPIQLSAERLRRRYGERLADDVEVFDKCVTTIVRQVGDIGRMVDEFSSFARMPSATPEMGDLSDTIRQVVFLETVRQPQIAMSVDLPDKPIAAYFDARLISQALTNLLKNAVESIEKVGISNIKDPQVSIRGAVVGDFARIEICDNGRGWPDENRHRLLEPYVTTRDKGTGLGLAIVAKIIEQHGGQVELRDAEPDGQGRIGACFCFSLPVAPASSGQSLPPASRPDQLGAHGMEGAMAGADVEGTRPEPSTGQPAAQRSSHAQDPLQSSAQDFLEE